MIANYHTHTWRCGHATGTEREYVENAIEGGLKILGFSDHTPEGYVSDGKMNMGQLEGYADTILGLKNEYRKDIEIHLGLEVEYYPKYFDALLEAARQYQMEYFLLGQHSLGNAINDFYCGTPTDSEERLIKYCRQTQEALETGYFTYFAHPDLIHFTGDAAIYDKWMRELCCHAKKLDVPLELNFLGLWERRHYPNLRFWKIAGEVGNKVIFGSDAHQADKVWVPEILSVAEKMVKEYNLALIDTVDFVTV